MHILQWARENGCPWNSYTCMSAFEYGLRNKKWEVLVWAVKNGVPMEYDHDEILAADDDDFDDTFFDDDDEGPLNLCSLAARCNRWDIVQFAFDHGCRCSEDVKTKLLNHFSSQLKLYNFE